MKKMRIAAGVMCTVMLMSGAAFAAETATPAAGSQNGAE